MSVNTNVHMVKEEYLAGHEDIYKDVKKTRQIAIEGKPYKYTKTYALSNDSAIKVNDLMQNKKNNSEFDCVVFMFNIFSYTN